MESLNEALKHHRRLRPPEYSSNGSINQYINHRSCRQAQTISCQSEEASILYSTDDLHMLPKPCFPYYIRGRLPNLFIGFAPIALLLVTSTVLLSYVLK